MRIFLISIILMLGTESNAYAVPLQLSQQGRLLEPSGSAVTGLQDLGFRIYDDLSAGNLLWEEVITIDFINGYYSAVLGADTANNPLDSDILSQYPIYMELELDNNGPMTPRQAINSAPYAQLAGVAESVDGGSVNASDISINNTAVVNASGEWIGMINVDWNTQITNIPADIWDGDDNTQLSESQVENYITNDAVDLHANTTIGGLGILTSDNTTLGQLSCTTDGDIAHWDSIIGWYCDEDIDTQLSESEVVGYVEAGIVNLAPGSTVNAQKIVGEPSGCTDAQVLVYTASSNSWVCGEDNDTTLTPTEMQTMIEAMTLNLQNRPSVNGDLVLTEASTLDPANIDSSNASVDQVLTYDGNAVAWADASSAASGSFYLGNITFSTDSAMSYFCQNYTGIYGNVTISGVNISNVDSLQCLSFIDGNLLINNSAIINIDGLGNLTSITGGVEVSNNSELANLDGLSNLVSVGKNTIGKSVILYQNAALNSIAGLSGLTSLPGALQIKENNILTDLDGLSGITSIGVENAGFSLEIYNNSSLVNIDNFANLSNLDGHLFIVSNTDLPAINGFNNLSTIDGYLAIFYNNELDVITGFNALTQVPEYIKIEYNGIWGTPDNGGVLSGFSSLQSVTQGCEVSHNDFSEISGFSSLQSVGGFFGVYNNDYLSILSGYNSLQSIGGALQVEQNQILPQSEVNALLNTIGQQNIGGGINICCNN